VTFEWDPAKSAANKLKHGLAFEDARAMWADPRGLEIPGRSDVEPRTRRIARFKGECWTAIHTQRGQSIRIISVRRAHPDEERTYEAQD